MWNFSGQNLTLNEDCKTSFNGVFSRLGCFRKSSVGLTGINKAGTIFFGIDAQYLLKVQKKEIFELVGYGFTDSTLMKMSIEERRFYYHMLVAKNNPKAGTEMEIKPKEKKDK